MQRRVIIYRDLLLPYSETFIPAQAESLITYTGFYVGTSRTANAAALIPIDRSITLSDCVSSPAVWKTAFKLGGFIHPRWLQQIQDLSACLIHAHFGIDGIWGLLLAKQLGLPLVVTFHGNDVTGMDRSSPSKVQVNPLDFLFQRGQFFRDLYVSRRSQLFTEVTCVIAVSEFIREQLLKKGCPADKVKVHYIGVDVEKFTADPTISRKPVVLFVGRLVEKKGCEYLIRAMAQVQTKRPDAELVIIGDGPLRPTLEKLASSLLKQYCFLGVQPPEAVKAWMNQALLLGTPSVTAASGDSEGLPIVILEAQAMGLPVIGSIHAGIPEAIVHAETGFLVAEKNSEELAEKILILLNNSTLWKQFSVAGRNRMAREFDLKYNTAKLEATYDQILKSRP